MYTQNIYRGKTKRRNIKNKDSKVSFISFSLFFVFRLGITIKFYGSEQETCLFSKKIKKITVFDLSLADDHLLQYYTCMYRTKFND